MPGARLFIHHATAKATTGDGKMSKEAVARAIEVAAKMIEAMDAEQKVWFASLSSDEKRHVICAGLAANAA